jgi:hypothetical protein
MLLWRVLVTDIEAQRSPDVPLGVPDLLERVAVAASPFHGIL